MLEKGVCFETGELAVVSSRRAVGVRQNLNPHRRLARVLQQVRVERRAAPKRGRLLVDCAVGGGAHLHHRLPLPLLLMLLLLVLLLLLLLLVLLL